MQYSFGSYSNLESAKIKLKFKDGSTKLIIIPTCSLDHQIEKYTRMHLKEAVKTMETQRLAFTYKKDWVAEDK